MSGPRKPAAVKDMLDAVMDLNDAASVTGDSLHLNGGAHFWPLVICGVTR